MATGTRAVIAAIPMNNTPNTPATFPVAPSAGYDLGSPGGTFTAWSGGLGVAIPNNGQVWLYYICGATAAGVYQVLIGDLIGNTGQVAPATVESGTITASSSGWLGPWSPATYNQQAPTLVTYAGAINTTALTQPMQGCVVVDFTTITTLSVRAYTLIPVTP
jgi:hypothetical protein